MVVHTAAWLPDLPDRVVVPFRPHDANSLSPVVHATGLHYGAPHQSPEALAAAISQDSDYLARFVAELQIVAPSVFTSEHRKSALDCSSGSGGQSLPLAPITQHTASEQLNSAPLATGFQTAVTGTKLQAYRLSLTFRASDLENARAALKRAADSALQLGMGRGLVGAIDVRNDGAGHHLYMLAVVASRDEAQAIKAAALEGVDYLPKAQKCGHLGFGRGATQTDYESSAAYLVKPWAVGQRNLDLDAVAVGSLTAPWTACRATQRTSSSTRTCAHCSKQLPPTATKRRTFCTTACRQKAKRKKDATETATGVASRAPDPEPLQPPTLEVATELKPASTLRIEQETPVSTDTNPEPETIIDPLKEAAEFAVWFEGPQAPPPDLAATVVKQLVHYGVQVPTQRIIDRALMRAIVATVTAA